MTFEKSFWTVIFLGLLGIAGWNIVQGNRMKAQLSQTAESSAATEEVAKTRAYELRQAGKFITWPTGMKVLGEPSQELQGYGLILVISDLSCDVCRDEQTQFVERLADRHEIPLVRVVVSANHIMYARSYMRLNGMAGPVYYDPDGRFLETNQLSASPLLLLHNPAGEVIAAHLPIPGKPEWSTPFHEMVEHFFEELSAPKSGERAS